MEEPARPDGDLRRVVRLEEAVEVGPAARHPVDDARHVAVARLGRQLVGHQPPAEEAPQQALHRIAVVGQQDPAQLVPHLQRRRCRLLVNTNKNSNNIN